MPRKTVKQKKDAIRPWRAQYDGKCPKCQGNIDAGSLVCRSEFGNVIHYHCHPDWRPAPFPGYTYQGRKLKPGEKLK